MNRAGPKFTESVAVLGRVLKFARQLRWRLHARAVNPERRLKKIFGRHQTLSVVQIGSNDGTGGDPLFSLINSHPGWNALLVEPVPYLFARLKQNYAGRPNLRFENAAIGETSGSLPFFIIDPAAMQTLQDLPQWAEQLGSFDRDHIVKHLGPAISPHVQEVNIPTLTLTELLTRHQIDRIDLLHIDTEGHDWRILSQLDLERFRPQVILFEYNHLSEEEYQAAMARLQKYYHVHILDINGDLLCELRRQPLQQGR